MSKDTHKKIALVTISLAGGGAERSTAMLSQMLSKNGCDVHLITLTDAIDYEYSGTLFNLGKYKTVSDSLVKRLRRFTKLKEYLSQEKFDFILDARNRKNKYKEWYYLNYLYKNERVIYITHSYKLDSYFPASSLISQKMIDRSIGVVGVSQAITDRINSTFKTDKAETIYNAIPPLPVVSNDQDSSYFIFAGRLVDEVKNVSLLIDAFAKAYSQNSDCKLKICGDGPDKKMLEQKVSDLGLQTVVDFEVFDPTIFSKMAQARALILTSHYEGFPMVVVEALGVGTPVISVDCKSGPNEVIKNKENGLLVENYNVEVLASAIHTFTIDDTLYERCKLNAKESVSHLSMEEIGKTWTHYLNSL